MRDAEDISLDLFLMCVFTFLGSVCIYGEINAPDIYNLSIRIEFSTTICNYYLYTTFEPGAGSRLRHISAHLKDSPGRQEPDNSNGIFFITMLAKQSRS